MSRVRVLRSCASSSRHCTATEAQPSRVQRRWQPTPTNPSPALPRTRRATHPCHMAPRGETSDTAAFSSASASATEPSRVPHVSQLQGHTATSSTSIRIPHRYPSTGRPTGCGKSKKSRIEGQTRYCGNRTRPDAHDALARAGHRPRTTAAAAKGGGW